MSKHARWGIGETAFERQGTPAVMSLNQAAHYLQVSKAHLSNVINGKVLGVKPVRSFRLGRRVLIKREWIDTWLEAANEVETAKC
jgi:excisionase family DNA binding protein